MRVPRCCGECGWEGVSRSYIGFLFGPCPECGGTEELDSITPTGFRIGPISYLVFALIDFISNIFNFIGKRRRNNKKVAQTKKAPDPNTPEFKLK